MNRPHTNAGSVALMLVLLVACEIDADQERRPDATNTAHVLSATDPPYALDSPDLSAALPGDLVEISGLTTLPDGRLAAIQDEVGIVFYLDTETGEVVDRHQFAGGGDYEGIAWAGDRLFVIQSNGRMHEISDSVERPQVLEIRTPLRSRNDVEGLAHDAKNGRLLIALKEDPGSGLDGEMRAVYAFNLAERALSTEPVFVIDTRSLVARSAISNRFKPSAIAIHPQSGDIYILSATAGALLILKQDGEERGAWLLPPELYEQAEGMTFLPDGTLFISSEGVVGPGMLYRYSSNQASRTREISAP